MYIVVWGIVKGKFIKYLKLENYSNMRLYFHFLSSFLTQFHSKLRVSSESAQAIPLLDSRLFKETVHNLTPI